MFPWVIIFVLFFVEAPGQLPPLNPALGQKSIDSSSGRHPAANAGSVMLTAELTRLNTDLLNITVAAV